MSISECSHKWYELRIKTPRGRFCRGEEDRLSGKGGEQTPRAEVVGTPRRFRLPALTVALALLVPSGVFTKAVQGICSLRKFAALSLDKLPGSKQGLEPESQPDLTGRLCAHPAFPLSGYLELLSCL